MKIEAHESQQVRQVRENLCAVLTLHFSPQNRGKNRDHFEFKERLESQQVSPRCTRSVWCSSLGGVSDHISLPLEISLTLSSMPQ